MTLLQTDPDEIAEIVPVLKSSTRIAIDGICSHIVKCTVKLNSRWRL